GRFLDVLSMWFRCAFVVLSMALRCGFPVALLRLRCGLFAGSDERNAPPSHLGCANSRHPAAPQVPRRAAGGDAQKDAEDYQQKRDHGTLGGSTKDLARNLCSSV